MLSKSRKLKISYPFLTSLALHIIAAVIAVSYPISQAIQEKGSSVSVEWVKNVPKPKLKQETPPKQPIEIKFNPERDIDPGSKRRTVLTSDSKIAWVLKKSDRIVNRSVELNKAPMSTVIPELMTVAQLKESYSNLSSLVSTRVGPVDGNGIVGNQVRAKGSGGHGTGSGAEILGLGGKGSGLYGDGLGGGSGRGGSALPFDRLGIIKFLEESGGKQKVIYCLDVSASMAMGSKLDVSIRAIKESLLQLEDPDRFNIIAFYSTVRSFKEDAVPATVDNIKKAYKFLDSFTPRDIENNMGTDILSALKHALSMEPAVIVLVTDIQPTRGEVDEDRIAEEVKKINKGTKIYGVGVEVWEPSPTGRLAKLLKMLTEQNNGEMRLAKSG